MNSLLVIFIVLSIINVIFSTIKSIVTVKGGAFSASILSALYYGYYNIVLIYTVAEFPLWQKIVVTFGCNLVGVFIVKWVENKTKKDKLWKVEVTVAKDKFPAVKEFIKSVNIPANYVDINKYVLVNLYCATQKESSLVKEFLKNYNAKFFVSESKNLF